MPRRHHEEALVELVRLGILEFAAGTPRTTRRWQSAMARAALRLRARHEREDLRIAICEALIETLGTELSRETMLDYVLALLPIEAAPFVRSREARGRTSRG